jgi:hypothetical protein
MPSKAEQPDDDAVTAKVQHATDLLRDAAVNDIWFYVRDNSGSLDSERACGMIRQVVVSATEAFHKRCEAALLSLKPLRKQLGALRLENKLQANVIAELTAEAEKGGKTRSRSCGRSTEG